MATDIQSQPPDVVVTVGSGESAKEFKCYRVLLSLASKYLDTMLSSSMKEGTLSRIDFSDKDPEEWSLFYELIMPQPIGKVNSKLNAKTAAALVPWFHEFQMDEHLEGCDKEITENLIAESSLFQAHTFWPVNKLQIESDDEHQARLTRRKEEFDTILALLQFTRVYGLTSATTLLEGKVVALMNMQSQTKDLFNFPTVRSLIKLILPLELNDDKTGLRMSDGESTNLWPAFEKIIVPHISTLTQDTLDDHIHFPLLFHSYMQIFYLKNDIEQGSNSREKFIKSLVNEFPQRLYNALPRHTTDVNAKERCQSLLAEYEKERE